MLTITKKRLKIVKLGAFDLSLPVLQNKSGGKPTILIINNLHGDELTGFYILKKLLNKLPNKINGKLTIITTANPLGLLHKQRRLPFDEEDLNRGYLTPSYNARGIAPIIRQQLVAVVERHNLIFDLHTFTRPCLSAAISLKQKNAQKQKLLNKYLYNLKTDIILAFDTAKTEEKRVSGALGAFMTDRNKIFIPIEYPPIRQMNDGDLERYADGLLAALSMAEINTRFSLATTRAVPIFTRQQIINRATGLFIPRKKLGEKIKKGDVIGTIMDPNYLESRDIRSPFFGTVIEIADRQFYLFGEKIATIGKKII